MQLFEKLIEYPEAVRLVLENTGDLPVENVPLTEARGLALAEDLKAGFDSPPFDNSAVDGYAVRGADAEAGRDFVVVDEAPAGRPAEKSVGEGEAIKIFTGGVIPGRRRRGRDGREHLRLGRGVRAEEGRLGGPERARAGASDVREGEVILRRRHGDRAAGDSAGCHAGLREPAGVSWRPRVAVLSTGTELVEPGTRELAPGEIFDSNSFATMAQAREAGAEARRLYAASDDPETLRDAVREALETADVVVTSGGVSVGEKDLVKATMQELGVEQVFWGVKFKPGKPLFFGTRDDVRVFGLPGNPVSAMVCFELFVRPALMR